MRHLAALVAFASLLGIVSGCRRHRWDGRPRHVEILRPFDLVALNKRPYRDGVSSYGFEVAGTCGDCQRDERIEVTVRPPATSAYVGRAVAPVAGDQWLAFVFVGDDRDNRLRDGDTLRIDVVVKGEDGAAAARGAAQRAVVVHGIP